MHYESYKFQTHNGSVDHPVIIVLSKCIFFWFLMRTSCSTVVTNYKNNTMVNSCNGNTDIEFSFAIYAFRLIHLLGPPKFGQTFVLIHPKHHSRIGKN